MPTDTVTPHADGSEVMASIDDGGGGARFVIADITAERSWLSIPEAAAASLAEWR